METDRREGFSKGADGTLDQTAVLGFYAGDAVPYWRHRARSLSPGWLARVGHMGQSRLPSSCYCFDCYPLGSMASEALEGPARFRESLPQQDSCDALDTDAAYQCLRIHSICVVLANDQVIAQFARNKVDGQTRAKKGGGERPPLRGSAKLFLKSLDGWTVRTRSRALGSEFVFPIGTDHPRQGKKDQYYFETRPRHAALHRAALSDGSASSGAGRSVGRHERIDRRNRLGAFPTFEAQQLSLRSG